MIVQEVILANVRCHRKRQLSLGEGLTILTGPNGSGKTSVLEALLYSLTGRSLRGAPLPELIASSQEFLRVETILARGAAAGGSAAAAAPRAPSSLTVAAAYSRSGDKRLTVDGAPTSAPGRWPDLLPVVTFTPDDLRLVKGSPASRREYLDRLADHRFPSYADTLRRYEEALTQRNALLRNPSVPLSDAAFLPWERLLAALGHALAQSRAALLAELAPLFQEQYCLLTGELSESVRLIYRTNVAGLDPAGYAARLAESRTVDRQRTFTHLGPHRDDFRILRQGLDARDFGSQGEQRTAVLALVLAEWKYWQKQGTRPLLLLDDVMSELDEARRHALLSALEGMGQVVITTVDLRYFSPHELAKARVVNMVEKENSGGSTVSPA